MIASPDLTKVLTERYRDIIGDRPIDAAGVLAIGFAVTQLERGRTVAFHQVGKTIFVESYRPKPASTIQAWCDANLYWGPQK